MNTLETLYFPDTLLATDRQIPLFLLFSTVHIILPVEAEEKSQGKLLDTFTNNQFCQVHTPHPLGKDRDRFLTLINDIKNKKDDYAAQLSNITLASMGNSKERGDDTNYEIVSSLLGHKNAAAEKQADKTNEALWQARLILKIGEVLDREEEEIAEALMVLEENEADLFTRMHGGDDDSEDESLVEQMARLKTKLVPPRPQSMKNRLRAWFRLIQDAAIPECLIWSTGRQEAADLLFENYEKIKKCPPALLAELMLPARTGWEGVVEKVISFRSEAEGLLKPLHAQLTSATADFSENQDFGMHSDEWQRVLDRYFPADQFGRAPLRFYLFEGDLPTYSGYTSDRSEKRAILAVFVP